MATITRNLRPYLKYMRNQIRTYAEAVSDEMKFTFAGANQVEINLVLYIYIYSYITYEIIKKELKCIIIPHDSYKVIFYQVFYDQSVIRQVDVPSFSGSFGILPKHVPTLAVLKPGVVTVYEQDGNTKKVFVSSGTVTINENNSVQVQL